MIIVTFDKCEKYVLKISKEENFPGCDFIFNKYSSDFDFLNFTFESFVKYLCLSTATATCYLNRTAGGAIEIVWHNQYVSKQKFIKS